MERWTYDRPFDLVDFPDDNAHYVVPADYVTTDDGTGLVHQAPAFGADDLAVCQRSTGCRSSTRSPRRATSHDGLDLVGGAFFKQADADLVERPRSVAAGCSATSPYEHSYPHCWRCHTPLMYYALARLVHPHHAGQGRTAARERGDHLVPGDHQVGPLRRLAAATTSTGRCRATATGAPRCRSGDATRPSSSPASARWPSSRADRARPVAISTRTGRTSTTCIVAPSPASDGSVPAGPRGDRRVVRLGLDAVRPVGLPARAGLGGGVRRRFPAAVHLRGDRPDARLVLLADGDRDAGVRPELVRERASASATSSPRTAARCPSTSATSWSRCR